MYVSNFAVVRRKAEFENLKGLVINRFDNSYHISVEAPISTSHTCLMGPRFHHSNRPQSRFRDQRCFSTLHIDSMSCVLRGRLRGSHIRNTLFDLLE